MKSSSHVAHIRQLASLGLPGTTIMPALLRAVRELVSAGSAGFFWVDDEGEMTNLYAERTLPPHIMKDYFARHYAGQAHAFRSKFLERANAAEPVSSSSPTAEFMRTPYYQEILTLLEAHHMLYAVIRMNSRLVGQLSLYRPRDGKPFTAADREAITGVCKYIAQAAASVPNSAVDGQFVEGDDEGMVVTDSAGQILHGSAHSLHLLARALQRNFNARTLPLEIGDALKGVARAMVERAAQKPRDGEARLARESFNGQWGRFVLSAFPLDDSGVSVKSVGIHIRRKEPFMMRLVEAMAKLDLSPQQREVALLLAQGKSNAEIAAALDVAANTANYHVKQLFARLDAHDRAQAIARILPHH